MDLEQWLGKLKSDDPFVHKVAAEYPAWLLGTFGSQVEITYEKNDTNQRLHIFVSGRRVIYCSFNRRRGVGIQLREPVDEDELLLRQKLSDPKSINPNIQLENGRIGCSFRMDTDGDYDLLKTITRRLVVQ